MITDRVDCLIDMALAEDVGAGDLTSIALIPEDMGAKAAIISREELVICGNQMAREVFRRIDSRIEFEEIFSDGAAIGANTAFIRLSGPFRGILSGERVALNFLQRLSGISTQTARFVAKARPRGIKILDTRKTTPGWRDLEKYAVRTGGGVNHRFGLYDQVLIKNNHIDALAFHGECELGEVVERARKNVAPEIRVEVEVRSEKELRSAVAYGAEAILLDNMNPQMLRTMVHIVRSELNRSDIFLEASGGINEESLSDFLITGLDAISVGALTHSVRSVDISLRFNY